MFQNWKERKCELWDYQPDNAGVLLSAHHSDDTLITWYFVPSTFLFVGRISYRIFSWRGKCLIEGGLGFSPGKMFKEWLSEVQFGFFVCFKPYILLVYSFIDEIVDILRRKVIHFLL